LGVLFCFVFSFRFSPLPTNSTIISNQAAEGVDNIRENNNLKKEAQPAGKEQYGVTQWCMYYLLSHGIE
jgi:hypothetical protein